jgi:O-antigen/teichoic acid export membrane protein
MPLLLLPFVSQVLSPADYGAASMLTAASLLLTAMTAAPLESLVFRFAAQCNEDTPPVLRVTGLYCYAVVPLVLGSCAVGVGLFLPNFLGVSGHLWGIELLAVAFQPAVAYFALPVVQARQDLKTFSWLACISIFINALSKVTLLLVFHLGVFGWVISDLISAVASAALALILVRPPRAKVTRRHIKHVINFAFPLIPHRASMWAISSVSRPALALVSSLTQVGLLSLGLNLASVANLLLAEINRAVLPRYSRETFPAPTGQTGIVVELQILLAFVVPSLIGSALALAGQWIFPAEYWPAFWLTAILLVAQAAFGIYLIPTNYLVQTAGVTRPVGIASASGAALVICGLLLFGRSYGAVGAAYATTTGFIVMALIAAGSARLLKLEVAWKSLMRYWIQTALAFLGLAWSVVALYLPVGSGEAKVAAVSSITIAATALLVAARRRRLSK